MTWGVFDDQFYLSSKVEEIRREEHNKKEIHTPNEKREKLHNILKHFIVKKAMVPMT